MFAVASAVYQLYTIAAYTNTNTHSLYVHLLGKLRFVYVLYCPCLCNSRKNPRNGLSFIRLVVIANPVRLVLVLVLDCLFDKTKKDAAAAVTALLLHISIHFYYTFYGGDIICSTQTQTHTHTYT